MTTAMPTAIARALSALVLAVNLTPCAAAPHEVYLRPEVKGTILEDGKSVAGVQLFLGKYPGKNEPCTEVGEVIPVSADGSFAWPSVHERRLTESPINPDAQSGTLTALCIRHPAKGVLIGAMMFMKQDAPVSLRLNCDVARPRIGSGAGPHTTSTMLGQAQHCEASS